MLNKVSTVSIMLFIVLGLIIYFGIRNGKQNNTPTNTTQSTSTTTTGSESTATKSSFKGRR